MQIPIYVLSLIFSTDRRAAIRHEFYQQGLDFTFLDAIDGADIPDEDFHRHYDNRLNARTFKRPLSRGEVACALGHRAIWKMVAHGPSSVALICEDDSLLSPGIGAFLRSAAGCTASFENVMVKLDSPARQGEIVGGLADVDIFLTHRLPARTTGYLLGRNAARTLLARTEIISRPIDAELKHYWEHGVPILLTRPRLVSFRRNIASNLSSLRAATKPSARWHRLIRNLRYQSAVNLGRLRSPLYVDRIPELLEMRKLLSDAK